MDLITDDSFPLHKMNGGDIYRCRRSLQKSDDTPYDASFGRLI